MSIDKMPRQGPALQRSAMFSATKNLFRSPGAGESPGVCGSINIPSLRDPEPDRFPK